ncbi:pimeloyl-ACP methyl ester carboxylesterase [Planomicrobium soli]|uniref:Pimeloyl-ACP methyl ester carboxylesterase n=1 Tax=Planomicrobium soli TaxID=1176648 RepID=A0A2P8H1K9_9BACL|nr:alpha/beta hydrolase [Planomicrobium soli]PSL40098.1 pimeloyl-ACP methyl ester carboxylesterase [Planomicrobium soli]
MKTSTEKKKTRPLWKKILFSLVALMVLLVITGTAFEAIASYQGAKKFPPEGKLVDVGGFELHIQQQGSGKPVILLETGSGLASKSWNDLPKKLADYGTVVTYDRAGYAWSDEATTERTGRNIVQELHTALKKEKIEGPYVLVGHSLGGMYARLFAQTYPNEVKGLVLLDARPEDFSKETAHFFEAAGLDPATVNTPSAGTLSLLKRIGVIRLMKNSILPGLPEGEQDRTINIEMQPKFFQAQEQELKNLSDLEDSIRDQSLGNIPLTVITHGIPTDATAVGISAENSEQMEKTWQEQQKQMLTLSTNSKLIVARKSGHFVMDDEPELVFNAIKERVQQTKQ